MHNEYEIPYWPPSPINGTSTPSCPEGFNGFISWKCGFDGQFVPEGPKINCSRKWILEFNTDKIKNMDNLSDEVEQLKNNMEKYPIKFPQELSKMVKIIQKIQFIYQHILSNNLTIKDHTSKQVKNVALSMIQSCSIVIKIASTWVYSKPLERKHLAGKILNSVHQYGITLGCFLANNKSNFTINPKTSQNIYLKTFLLNNQQPIFFQYPQAKFELKNPFKHLNNISNWCPHPIGIGSFYKSLSLYMSNKDDHLKINSEIIAFSYNNITNQTQQLYDDNQVKVSLFHHQLMDFGSSPKCVFWDYNTDSWSSKGCYVNQVESNRKQTTCICNHLTNFAVLMDVSNRETPSVWKSIFTIINCTISIICLIFTIIFLSICPELRSRRNSIVINISSIIIIINLLVIFGLDQINHPVC